MFSNLCAARTFSMFFEKNELMDELHVLSLFLIILLRNEGF